MGAKGWQHQNAIRPSTGGERVLGPLVYVPFFVKKIRPPIFNFLSLSVLQFLLCCAECEPTWSYLQIGKVACKWPQIKHIIISTEQNPFGTANESEAGKLKQKARRRQISYILYSPWAVAWSPLHKTKWHFHFRQRVLIVSDSWETSHVATDAKHASHCTPLLLLTLRLLVNICSLPIVW